MVSRLPRWHERRKLDDSLPASMQNEARCLVRLVLDFGLSLVAWKQYVMTHWSKPCRRAAAASAWLRSRAGAFLTPAGDWRGAGENEGNVAPPREACPRTGFARDKFYD